jgi:double zinc ribbon protein
MAPLAYFGISSSGLTIVIDLMIVFAVVLYLSLIYWTFADARRRIADPALVACSTVASMFPYVGTIIYMVLRPPEYLEDVRERELEMQAAEARLYQLEYELCPHCDYRVERDFVRCPSCLRKLKDRCVSCTRPLDRSWTICPYCETEVPGSATAGRSRRRRAEGDTVAAREITSSAARSSEAIGSRSRARAEQPTSPDLLGEPLAPGELAASTRAATAPEPAAPRTRTTRRATPPS